MNPTMRAYQAMNKAAADVEAGKTGAKTRLAAAKKRYLALVAKNAKKEADGKIADSKKKAANVGKKKRATAKKKTTAKKTTAKRKTTTTRKKKTTGRR